MARGGMSLGKISMFSFFCIIKPVCPVMPQRAAERLDLAVFLRSQIAETSFNDSFFH